MDIAIAPRVLSVGSQSLEQRYCHPSVGCMGGYPSVTQDHEDSYDGFVITILFVYMVKLRTSHRRELLYLVSTSKSC
jgi:hypothetical protein